MPLMSVVRALRTPAVAPVTSAVRAALPMQVKAVEICAAVGVAGMCSSLMHSVAAVRKLSAPARSAASEATGGVEGKGGGGRGRGVTGGGEGRVALRAAVVTRRRTAA